MQKSALKRGMGRMMVINIREKGEGGGLGLWNVYQGEENGGEGENE